MLLSIGPAGRYAIMALIFLVVLAGGTYLAFRSDRQSSPKRGKAGPPQTPPR